MSKICIDELTLGQLKEIAALVGKLHCRRNIPTKWGRTTLFAP